MNLLENVCFGCLSNVSVRHYFSPLLTGNLEMGTLANSEDPDEMPQNVAFHQGLHGLLRQNLFFRESN